MDTKTARRKTDTLQKLLNSFGQVFENCFVTDRQKQLFDEFKIEVLAEADAEICHAENMEDIETNKYLIESKN